MYDCSLKRICDRISKGLALAGGVGLTLMMLTVFVNILTRKFLNHPIFGTTELVRYLSLFVGSVGLFRLEWGGGNIRMTLLVDSVSRRSSRLLEFIANSLGCVGFGGVTYFMFVQSIAKYHNGAITENLKIPMFILYGVLAIGFAILTICIGIKAALFLTAYCKDRPETPPVSSK